MTPTESRFLTRLLAWIVANIAFYVIQQRFGWLIAFAMAGFTASARSLAKADFQKALEERDGLQK